MGKNSGMLKYMVFAPIARPINFFKYGVGFAAGLSALHAANDSTQPLVAGTIAYFSMKYLPPTNVEDVLIPIILGALVAGLKWRDSQDWY